MPLARRGHGGPRGARLHLPLCAQLDRLGFHVRFLEWYEAAGMDDARSSWAVHRFNGDSLAISACHSSNSEGSVRPSVHLGESLMALEDKLAGLEVEQERGHLPPILATAGERTYALLALTHPSSPQFL